MNEITTIDVTAEINTSEATEAPVTAIAIIAPAAMPTLLSADTTDILGKLRAELAGYTPDASTEAGRAEIGSKAKKVGTAKRDFERLADAEKADHQASIKKINAEYHQIEENCDAIRDAILAPRNAYLQQEKDRVAAHEAALMEIEILASVDGRTAEQINEHIWKVPAIDGRVWQEFSTRAERVIAITLERLKVAHAAAVEREAAEVESERVRQAEVDRIAAENEAKRLQREKEIADNARAVAIMEAEQRAEQERQTAALALAEVEEKRRQAEADRIAAQDRAERERRDRLTQAIGWMKAPPPVNPDWEIAHQISHIDSNLIRLGELIGEHDWQDMADEAVAVRDATTERLTEQRDKLVTRQAEIEEGRRQNEADEAARREEEAATAATLAEQQRAAAQKAEEQRQTDLRAANVAHQRKINREVVADLVALGLTADQGKTVMEALVRRAIKHCLIQY